MAKREVYERKNRSEMRVTMVEVQMVEVQMVEDAAMPSRPRDC